MTDGKRIAMKKLFKQVRRGALFSSAVAASLSLSLLTGCKSTKQAAPEPVEQDKESVYVPAEFEEINPLVVLSGDSSIYVNIPGKKHVELTSALLMDEIENLSEADAKTVAKKLDHIYVGLGTAEDRSRLEISAIGFMPSAGVKSVFSKSNGWSKSTYEAISTEYALKHKYPNVFDYYTRDDSDYAVSFPSKSVLLLAKDVVPLMEMYAQRPEVADTPYNNWVNVESDDILIYITRPGQYLRSLIGQSINAGTDCIYGFLKKADSTGDLYLMTFDIHSVSTRTIPALKSLLSLSFGLTGAGISDVDEYTVRLSDVEVTKQQIVNLLTRDPVTGKHYKVTKDKVVEEDAK